jgi:adenylate cyclase
MGREIERKYLVKGDDWRRHVTRTETMRLGYLSSSDGVTVRIRSIDDRTGRLTIKSGGSKLERAEFEYEVPIADALELLDLCPGRQVEKHRHHLDLPGGEWVVDEFDGRHAGLIVLEVELPQIDTTIERPSWLGEEVTGNPAYYNSSLASLPQGGEI